MHSVCSHIAALSKWRGVLGLYWRFLKISKKKYNIQKDWSAALVIAAEANINISNTQTVHVDVRVSTALMIT